MRLEVPLSPLSENDGSLVQVLTWASDGRWTLQEQISYRELVGDDTFQRHKGDPSPLAAGYASFITQINEVEGLELFIPDLPTDLDEPCDITRTRITLQVYDEPRKRTTTWIRCADGSLSTLTPAGAGPDPAASRVVTAALLVRDAILGPDFVSNYNGSVPFGTLDRGEDSNAVLDGPFYLLDQVSWTTFWQNHSGGATPPAVDFDSEMVVVAAVGQRQEAGDSVEVRRILRVDQGTLTFVRERVPGDFCSPAARAHIPFHVVVAPRTPSPYAFADIEVERVSCGG